MLFTEIFRRRAAKLKCCTSWCIRRPTVKHGPWGWRLWTRSATWLTTPSDGSKRPDHLHRLRSRSKLSATNQIRSWELCDATRTPESRITRQAPDERARAVQEVCIVLLTRTIVVSGKLELDFEKIVDRPPKEILWLQKIISRSLQERFGDSRS